MNNLLANKPSILVSLNKLTPAEENLRYGQEADGDIAELSQTLAPTASGLIQPLLVQKSKKKGAYEIIDGRRRWLAFGMLIEQEVIPAGHEIPCIVCETEEEIIAASIIANTQRRDPTHADSLITVKRLMAKNFNPETLAKVLGHDMKEIKKLLKLSSVDDRFLSAYQNDKIDLAALKVISRVTNETNIEALAQRVETTSYKISGQELQVYNNATVADQYFQAVGMNEYTTRGGRVEADLFGERADSILDTGLLRDIWMEKTVALFSWLTENNVHTEYFAGSAPNGYDWLSTYRFESLGDEEMISSLRNQQQEITYAINDIKNNKGGISDFTAYIEALNQSAILEAQIYIERAKPLTKFAAVIDAGHDLPIRVRLYVEDAELNEYKNRKTEEVIEGVDGTTSDLNKSTLSDLVEVETEGFSHSHHERTTTIAGKSLGLSLSQMPMAALDLTIATMFRQVCLCQHGSDIYILSIRAEQSIREETAEYDQFTGPIVTRLKEYLDLFKAFKTDNAGTGDNTPFLWISSLDQFEKLDLLANLTGYQVNMTEIRTNMVRKIARAEAAHVTSAIGHDIRSLWMPDAKYYAGFGKPALLGFIEEMGLESDTYSAQKRADLAQTVTELSIERNFAPKALTFTLASMEDGTDTVTHDIEQNEPSADLESESDFDDSDIEAAA